MKCARTDDNKDVTIIELCIPCSSGIGRRIIQHVNTSYEEWHKQAHVGLIV